MLNITRKVNEGVRLEITPSDVTQICDIRVIGFDETRHGRPIVKIGFIAPQTVIIDRHETLSRTEMVDLDMRVLGPGDPSIIQSWCRDLIDDSGNNPAQR